MAAVLHHSRAKGTAKLVLLGIANHEGDGGAWPTVSTLARYANVEARNVRKALRQLEASGELRTLTQTGGMVDQDDETRPNLYRVQIHCPVDCDGTAQHRTTASRTRYPMLPLPGQTPGRYRQGGGDGSDRRGGSLATGGGGTPASAKPPTEPEGNHLTKDMHRTSRSVTREAGPCPIHPGASRRGPLGECSACWSDRMTADRPTEGVTA